MKQGWKIFWIVCAVTALVGIIFCVVGLGLGVTLEQLNAAYRWNWDDPDLDEHTHGASETADGQTGQGYTGISSIDVEVEKAAVVIQEYNGTEVLVDGSGLHSQQKFSCRQDGSDLDITVDSQGIASNEGTLILSIPADMKFSEVSLDVGGGLLQIEKIEADSLDITVGAGEADVEQFTVNELDVECGAGSAALGGEVMNEANLECGVGEMTVELEGSETDYNYTLECGIGSIRAGDREYSGLGSRQEIDNAQNRTIHVKCGVGSVELLFAL